jgi:hypothetical protein
MTDPLRTDRRLTAGEVPDRDRDTRIEELLLLGLDHYFRGQHELAISVWTRVLFLDRGHARARAYIERARSAVAERQREGEELLHTGAAAFHRGDAGAARRLLTLAVERGAASEEALALLDRLDRLEVTGPGTEARGLHPTVAHGLPDAIGAPTTPPRKGRLAWIATGVVTGFAAAAALWFWGNTHVWWRDVSASAPPAAVQVREEPLPVPTVAEASLTRARALNASGRLHDALAALDLVRHGDVLRPQADDLRAQIQRQLLEAAHSSQTSSTAAPPTPAAKSAESAKPLK